MIRSGGRALASRVPWPHSGLKAHSRAVTAAQAGLDWSDIKARRNAGKTKCPGKDKVPGPHKENRAPRKLRWAPLLDVDGDGHVSLTHRAIGVGILQELEVVERHRVPDHMGSSLQLARFNCSTVIGPTVWLMPAGPRKRPASRDCSSQRVT